MSARDLADAIGVLASIVADAADTRAAGAEGELLAALDAVGELSRRVGALGVALSAACAAYRSRDGDTLPMRTGMRDIATLVSVRTGLDAAEASQWASVAVGTATRTSLAGETLPAAHPRVADALAAGTLSVDGATRICATLADAAAVVDDKVADGLERTLVAHAPSLTARELRRLCRQVLDRCAPEDAPTSGRRASVPAPA